jgi:hypothetical protein
MSLRSDFTNGLLRTYNRSTSIFHEVNVTTKITTTAGETPRVKPEVRRKGGAATLFGRLMLPGEVGLVQVGCQGESSVFVWSVVVALCRKLRLGRHPLVHAVQLRALGLARTYQ